ncbi:MAG: glycosyltransferase family 4 protein [Phycisphaerae bacterium]
MQLLYVCSDFGIKPDGTKGAAVHLRAITRALAETGHPVRLLSPHPGPNSGHPAAPLLESGCSPVERPSRMLKTWLRNRGYDGGVAGELRPLLYNAWAASRALDALAARRPDAIIERLSLFGHVGLDLAEALDVPLVVEVNAILTEEAERFRSLDLRTLAESIQKRVLRAAEAVLPVSAGLAERLEALGVAPDRIHVVPNGVDIRQFDRLPSRDVCRAELDLGDAFVVGFAGSLKPWHGVDVLLDAFKRLHREEPAARLLIVGDGPAADDLKRSASDRGIGEAVRFTGAVPHERVPAMLRAMDVAVAPFRQMEQFYFSPIKLFEYMASGTCLVATRLGQIGEVVEDGAVGLLCDPDDANDLYEKLTILRRSVDLRERLAGRALRAVRQRYTWRHAARRTERALQEVVTARRRIVRSDRTAGVSTTAATGACS